MLPRPQPCSPLMASPEAFPVRLVSSWDIAGGPLAGAFAIEDVAVAAAPHFASPPAGVAPRVFTGVLLRGGQGSATPCNVAAQFLDVALPVHALELCSSARFVEAYSLEAPTTSGDSSWLGCEEQGEYLGTIRCAPLTGPGAPCAPPAVSKTELGDPPNCGEAEITVPEGDAWGVGVKWMKGTLALADGPREVHGLRLKFLGLPAPKDALHLAQLRIHANLPPPPQCLPPSCAPTQSAQRGHASADVADTGRMRQGNGADGGSRVQRSPAAAPSSEGHVPMPGHSDSEALAQLLLGVMRPDADEAGRQGQRRGGESSDKVRRGEEEAGTARLGRRDLENGAMSGSPAQNGALRGLAGAHLTGLHQDGEGREGRDDRAGELLVRRMEEQDRKLDAVLKSFTQATQGLQVQMAQLSQRVGKMEVQLQALSLENSRPRGSTV